jgi:hypothetical protein
LTRSESKIWKLSQNTICHSFAPLKGESERGEEDLISVGQTLSAFGGLSACPELG